MRIRPIGVSIFAALFAVNVVFYLVLAALAALNRGALTAVLHALSPSGVGPEAVHAAMGRLLPFYYAAMSAVTAVFALGFWRMWNWTRIAVLAMTAISFVFLVAEMPLLFSAPTSGAIALTIVRVALCALVAWYLLSRPVREAYGRAGRNGLVAEARRAR